ncbi:hypothetical protein OROHE_001254 [Orobanche hederae]
MDSENLRQFSQSNIDDSSTTQPSFNLIRTPNPHQQRFIDVDQFHSNMISSNHQYQPPIPNNLINSHISSQSQQQFGPNLSFQDLLTSPNLVYVSAPSQPSNMSKRRKKTSNTCETTPPSVNQRWTLAEDIALTNARLYVSCDADIGVGQKSETLWSRIFQVWKDCIREFDATRDSKSLENRWGRLQGAINKFHGIYELCERKKLSGYSLEDVKKDALRTYQETSEHNQPFKHEECWEICRKNVKWCTQLLTKQNATKKQKPVVDSSNVNSLTSKETQPDSNFIPSSSYAPENSKINESGDVVDEGVARPTGRKYVKDQKKRMVAEKGVAEALGNLQTFLKSQVDLNRVELELKKEKEKKDYELREKIFTEEIEFKKQTQKRKDQERILDKDLSRLAPNLRKKYEQMQAQILKEWEKDGYFGDAELDSDDTI